MDPFFPMAHKTCVLIFLCTGVYIFGNISRLLTADECHIRTKCSYYMLDGGDQIVRDVGSDCSFSEDREETRQDSSLGDAGEEGGGPECFRLHNVSFIVSNLEELKSYLILPYIILSYLFRGG